MKSNRTGIRGRLVSAADILPGLEFICFADPIAETDEKDAEENIGFIAGESNIDRTARLKRLKAEIESKIKIGDLVERVNGRKDTYLGLFQYSRDGDLSKYGWYALLEFTEARGHRVRQKVKMWTLLNCLQRN